MTSCQLRNKVQYMYEVRKAKQCRNAQCRNSSSDLWKTLKNSGISKKESAASSIGLDIDSKITFDKKIVADIFNFFFTTVHHRVVLLVHSLTLITVEKCEKRLSYTLSNGQGLLYRHGNDRHCGSRNPAS